MAIFHIYGARANFLLFCDHQDTATEEREMEIGGAGKYSPIKIYQRIYRTKIFIF